MNLLTMLTQASAPPETRKRGSNLSSIHDAQRRATENKYRKHLQGQTLTTTELAKRMGVNPQNIGRTLDRMATAGLIKRIETGERVCKSGRAPIRWTWVIR